MNELKRKITFENKEDSINLNPDSRYILTANDINEIKEVVNKLSDELDNRLKFNHVFKFSRFNIPSTLKSGYNYNFIFELSDDINFETNVVSFNSYSDNYSLFSIFENGTWKQFQKNQFITKNDANKILKVDLSTIISDEKKYYFGRYKWKNDTINKESDWQGFCLSVYEYNDDDFEKNILDEIYISGKSSIFENEKNIPYSVIVKDKDQNIFDVTENAKFTSLLNNVKFKRNMLSSNKFHKQTFDIILAEVTFENIKYKVFLNILINPILLEKIEIVKDFNVIRKDEKKIFFVKAYWSNGVMKDVTNESKKTLTLGNCTLNNNTIIGNGEYDTFGKLTVSYHDDDEFYNIEKIEVSEYLNYEILKIKNFKINFPELIDIENDKNLKYSINLVYSNNFEKDITNDVEVKIIDSNEISCKNGVIEINKNNFLKSKNINILFLYKDSKLGYEAFNTIKTIFITSNLVDDLDIKILNEQNIEIDSIIEDSLIKYKINGKYQDNTINDVTNICAVESLDKNVAIVNESNKTIKIKNIEKESILILKATFLNFNNVKIEKTFLLKIKPKFISKLIPSSNYINNDLSTEWTTKYTELKEINFKGVFSNGIESDVTNNVEIKLASGNSNLVKSINGNIISFNEPNILNESLCFIGTYKDINFESKNMNTYFVINVSKL